MSIEYLQQLLPIQQMPVRVKATLEGVNLAKVRNTLELYLDSDFERELAKWILSLLGGSGEGIATLIGETPTCVQLARRFIPKLALDLEMEKGLAKVERGLVELSREGYSWLARLPEGDPDASNWVAAYYSSTAGTALDQYFGLYHYHFFRVQSHKLAKNTQVGFTTFYRARVRLFLHLTKLNLGWQELPLLSEVQNEAAKVKLLLDQLKSRMASGISAKAGQDMLKLVELLVQFVLESDLSEGNDQPATATVVPSEAEIIQSSSAPELSLSPQDCPMPVVMSNAVLVPVEKLRPGPYQMRRDFDEASLQELAEDIGERGILEPLVVRPDPANLTGANYMIIAGERRYRAAKRAGLTTVPVIIRQMDEHEAEMAALAENLQRQDLNPLEEQQLFQSLQGQYNWSISEIARRIHKSRHYVQQRLYGTLASFDTNSETQTTEVMAVAINQAELADHAEIAEVSENEMLLAVYPLSDEQNSNRTLSGQEAQAELDETLPTTNTGNSAVSRLPAMSSFVRFGRAVDRIINAVELLGLSDEAIRQEWLAHLDLLTTKLNQLKVCLDD